MAECSIIIVTYNGWLEHTVPCLESILNRTHGEDYEIIVVDNNSSDGTQSHLTELASREPRLSCVLNKTNRGFAGGNNDGIGVATGSVIVLLNNDTQVSDGWLSTIRSALLSDPSIGLLGPVSNAVGNEQKIFTVGSTPSDILAEGERWTRHAAKSFFETGRLGFFCVALRRDLLDSIGLLDEAYDLGFYEDDDYCLRVRQAGYRLVCREDLFVYHRGSASFDKVPHITKGLLKKNLRSLEKKFNIRYNPRHPRDCHLDLIAGYAQTEAEDMDAARFRSDNRLRIINGLMPRGFIKRWRYKRRLSSILSEFK